MKDNKDIRIGVIGGGLSGLVIAEGLQRKGYKNVTLFEKNTHLGGKLYSIFYKERSYELGAIFGLPSYANLRKLMDRLGIKADGPKLIRANYNTRGEKVMPIPREDLDNFVKELERLPKVLENYNSLKYPYIKEVEPPLMEPFSKWCDIHKFSVLKTIYTHYFTIFGLGNIEEVPSIYVLRIVNFEHLMSFMDIPKFYTWKEGVSIISNRLAGEVEDIRLGQEVIDIKKLEDNGLQIVTDFEQTIFDKVIITSPLDHFSHIELWDEEIKKNFKNIRYQNFNTYAFIVDNVPKGCGCILDNLSPDRQGHVTIWDSRWSDIDGKGMVILYAYHPPRDLGISPLDYIKEDLNKLGIKNPRLYQAKGWKHCPYVKTENLKEGFYEIIQGLQGINNIYLAGEIISGLSIENSISHSNYLIEEYF